MRDSFVFYRSFYESIKRLPPEDFKRCVSAIAEYALDGITPDSDGIERTVFELVKPQIDVNYKKYQNGTKGGRPVTKSNQNVTKQKPSVTKAEPNVNVNDNVNVNGNKDNVSSCTSAEHAFPSYPYKEVVSYLNSKANTAYRSDSKDTQKRIRARCEEGYTLEDFKVVVDKKVKEWGAKPKPGDKDMRPYLRPSTLFGSKFGEYLGQIECVAKGTGFNNFDGRDYAEGDYLDLIEK